MPSQACAGFLTILLFAIKFLAMYLKMRLHLDLAKSELRAQVSYMYYISNLKRSIVVPIIFKLYNIGSLLIVPLITQT